MNYFISQKFVSLSIKVSTKYKRTVNYCEINNIPKPGKICDLKIIFRNFYDKT